MNEFSEAILDLAWFWSYVTIAIVIGAGFLSIAEIGRKVRLEKHAMALDYIHNFGGNYREAMEAVSKRY